MNVIFRCGNFGDDEGVWVMWFSDSKKKKRDVYNEEKDGHNILRKMAQ